jgi:hypothetical protein
MLLSLSFLCWTHMYLSSFGFSIICVVVLWACDPTYNQAGVTGCDASACVCTLRVSTPQFALRVLKGRRPRILQHKAAVSVRDDLLGGPSGPILGVWEEGGFNDKKWLWRWDRGPLVQASAPTVISSIAHRHQRPFPALVALETRAGWQREYLVAPHKLV